MASPFNVFRSNLKPLMVALTLLALFAFVVLPAVDMYQRANLPGGTDMTVATFKGGKFESDEIAYYQRLHGQTNRFLSEVAEQVVAAGGTPRVPNYGMNNNRQMNFGISPATSPPLVVMTKLYAERASELGMELDDTAIRNWLDLFTDGKLSTSQLAAIRAQSSQNTLGEAQMFSLLRTELLANLYDKMMTTGLTTGRDLLNSPIVTWNQFLKINQQAKATAYPILVEEFVKEAPEPNAATIEKLYEEGKDRNPAPDSPEPGFRKLYSANIEYVAAHLEDFLGREIAKLSEEELRAEYDRRIAKGEFVMPALDFTPGVELPETDLPEGSAEPATETPVTETPAPSDAPSEATPATEPPAAETPAAETPAEPAETPATPKEAPAVEEVQPESPAGEDQPAGDGNTDPQGGESGENSGDQPLSAILDRSVKLVSFAAVQDGAQEPVENANPDSPAEPATQDPAPEQPATEQPATQDPAPEQPATEQPATQDPAPEQPATEQPATQDPAPEQPAPEQPATQDPAPEQPATEQPATQDPAPEQPATEQPAETTPAGPKPFEEVRDQIARDLAMPAATAAQQEAIGEVYDLMKDYLTELVVWESDKEGEKPAPPDLKKLADQMGLRYETTGTTTALDVYQTTLGLAKTGVGGMGSNLTAAMYNDSRPVYAAIRAENRTDISGQISYAAWKTEAKEGYVPKLDEVRDEVIAAAKLQSARELAEAKAKELAEQANANPDKPLAELVPETRRTLVFDDLGPFPWMMSFGFQFGTFMGEVPELDNVGNDFMKTVFAGPVGQYRVAPNVPKSVFYVVKATEITPPAEELRTRFMQANQRAMAEPLTVDDIREIRKSAAESFEKSIGLEFSDEALSGN